MKKGKSLADSIFWLKMYDFLISMCVQMYFSKGEWVDQPFLIDFLGSMDIPCLSIAKNPKLVEESSHRNSHPSHLQ